ncbi:MAG: ubiquinone/menaquinone biosynthesis methyltransferase [Candidatus Palauibacterales bacterium]|nr:ubiquinone/menaquinone biosynthesis methyltransferase [Candidatus Palauibacterales bacterium]
MATSQELPPTPLEAGSPAERARAVREMFSAIAPRYDLLNHLLSLNIDRFWRRRAIDHLGWEARPRGLYLDSCTGTYDLAIELAHRPGFAGRVVAADFADAMLREGRPKIRPYPVIPVNADALHLPAVSGCFDGAMIAFGIRNLTDIDAGVRELHRVLRPGGHLVILDFSTPERQPLRGLYLNYFTRLLPLVGRLVSKHSYAYSYLPESVRAFDEPDQLAERLRTAGFVEIGWKRLSGGIACLWWGERGVDPVGAERGSNAGPDVVS